MFLLLSVQPVAIAATTKVTLQTNQSTYPVGLNKIFVSGNVTPPPSENNTWIGISIRSPDGAMVDANQFEVTLTGTFNGTFVTGGPTYTGPGTYTVNAVYDNVNASAIFQYGNSHANQSSASTSTTQSTTATSTTTSPTSISSTTSIQTTTTAPSTSIVTSNSTTTSAQTSTSTSHSTTSSSSSAALEIGPVALVLTIAVVALISAVLVRIRRPSPG
jgi:hypothetical protein